MFKKNSIVWNDIIVWNGWVSAAGEQGRIFSD